MKKAIFTFMALLLSGAFAPLFPCDVYLETARAAASGKDAIQVKLFVELVHKRCPVDIARTKLSAAGLTIEKQGPWQKVGAGVYRKDLVVCLDGKSKGEIRVLRECPKTGRQEEVLGVARI